MSQAIFANLLTIDQFRKADTIHCFLSASIKKEIDTEPIISWMQRNRKEIAVPKTEEGSPGLKQIKLGSESGFQTNRWGISEPVDGFELDEKDIDVVLVPMVAADREKNRLGYGKGFYDRFLSGIDAFRIGMVGQMFIHDKTLPSDSFDVPMDIIVTDREILY